MPQQDLIRWIVDRPADGPANMARDEAILLGVSAGLSPPTLRFYAWSPATISLGYFQCYSDYAALPPPAGHLPVVRRLTGGGAILHDRELTYSLSLPIEHRLVRACGPSGLYDVVHTAFSDILRRAGIETVRGPATDEGASHRGPFFCFERHSRHDLLLDGRKLMGSAQRRLRTAVLQHGSLILDSRFDQQACAPLPAHAVDEIEHSLSRLAERISGIPSGEPASLSHAELLHADELRAKYEDPDWTRRR